MRVNAMKPGHPFQLLDSANYASSNYRDPHCPRFGAQKPQTKRLEGTVERLVFTLSMQQT